MTEGLGSSDIWFGQQSGALLTNKGWRFSSGGQRRSELTFDLKVHLSLLVNISNQSVLSLLNKRSQATI